MNKLDDILFLYVAEDIKELIVPKLKEYNFTVKVCLAEDHLEVESLFQNDKVGCIISDFGVWGLFGMEIVKRIEEMECRTPYILIGGEFPEDKIISFIELGVTDYIQLSNIKRLISAVKRENKTTSFIKNLRNYHFSQCLLEEEFQTLLKISDFLIYQIDLGANFFKVNDIFTEYLGYEKQVILESMNIYDLVHPDDKSSLREAIQNARNGTFVKNVEFRFRKKDGAYMQLSSTYAPIFSKDNKVTGILCVSRDLTEYRETQHFIEDRMHRQAIIAKFGLEAISEKDIDKLFNKATSLLADTLEVEYTKILELTPDNKVLKLRAGVGWHEGLVGNTCVENNKNSQAGYTLLKTSPVIVENLEKETRFFAPQLLADHNVISGMSVIIPGPDSPFGILGAHTDKHHIFSKDDSNFLQSIANILADVIVRNSKEQELRESEEKYRMLTEQSLLGTIIIAEEHIMFANQGVSDILGFSIDELMGWNLDTISKHIHPDDLSMIIAKYNQILNDETPSLESEIRMKRKDNSYLYTRQFMKKIKFRGNSALHINIIDITEQKRNESLLESSLEEKEILLKEIHHRVKNNLQIMSSLIVLQEQYVNDEQTLHVFKDFQSRIKSMALIHQILYNSENFNKIDLSKYIKDLVDNLFKIYSANPNYIKLALDIEDIDLSLDKAISCGLIINELVSNSLKYAFHENEKGKIGVNLKKSKSGKFLLEVYDNGKGLPKGMNFEGSDTLGLKLITTITKQMDGKIIINEDDGAHVTISW